MPRLRTAPGQSPADLAGQAWLGFPQGECDPLGFEAGDANLYRYVGNNPTNATDPTGLEEVQLFPNKMGQKNPKKLKEEQEAWDKDKDTLSKSLIVVKKESDIPNNIKAGQDAKYVVTKDGTLVVIKDNRIPHSFGSASAGGKVGEDIQAGGAHEVLPRPRDPFRHEHRPLPD
jgi:hypothetical protein